MVVDQQHGILKENLSRLDLARCSALRPPPVLPMWKWCEENLRLTRRQGVAFPGPYDTGLTPWVRGWFDALMDPTVHTIVIKKGAQVGATQFGYAAMAYWVCEDPDPIMVVMASVDDCKSVSKNRIMPLFEDSPRVAEEMTGDPDDWTALHYKLRRTFIRFVGANAPGKLATFAHRYVLVDELDKYRRSIGREGSVLGLITARTKWFWNRKRLLMSTPTTAAGMIHQEHEQGDQQEYMVTCPRCQKQFSLSFDLIKFDEGKTILDRAKTARYQCPTRDCGYEFGDDEKHDLVAQAEWVATAKAQSSGYASFMLPGFYSHVDSSDAPAMVEKFLGAKDDPARLQELVNQDFGQLWEEPPKKAISIQSVKDRQKEVVYQRGTVPLEEPCLLVTDVDVQANYFVHATWALRLGSSALVDHGYISTWEELQNLRQQQYILHDGTLQRSSKCLLDCGYDTMNAYKFALRNPDWVIPIMGLSGSGRKQVKPISPSKIDSFPGGRLFGGRRSLVLYHIHPSFFKDLWGDHLNGEGNVKLMLHSEVDEDYAKQATGEVLKEGKMDTYGNVPLVWVRIRENHFFDLGQYMEAARHMAHQDLLLMNQAWQEEQEKGQEEQPDQTPVDTEPSFIDRDLEL